MNVERNEIISEFLITIYYTLFAHRASLFCCATETSECASTQRQHSYSHYVYLFCSGFLPKPGTDGRISQRQAQKSENDFAISIKLYAGRLCIVVCLV